MRRAGAPRVAFAWVSPGPERGRDPRRVLVRRGDPRRCSRERYASFSLFSCPANRPRVSRLFAALLLFFATARKKKARGAKTARATDTFAVRLANAAPPPLGRPPGRPGSGSGSGSHALDAGSAPGGRPRALRRGARAERRKRRSDAAAEGGSRGAPGARARAARARGAARLEPSPPSRAGDERQRRGRELRRPARAAALVRGLHDVQPAAGGVREERGGDRRGFAIARRVLARGYDAHRRAGPWQRRRRRRRRTP